jgi:hypothetical protein
VGGYRRDIVHRVLSERGAIRVGASPDSERWTRADAKGGYFEAVLGFTRGGDLLFGNEIRYLASALDLDPDEVIRRVEALGGLWRRPGDP